MRRRTLFVVMAVALLVVPAIPVAAKKPSEDPLPPPGQVQPTIITFLEPRLPLPATAGDVQFYFNPTELSVNKSVPWGHHSAGHGDSPNLEFTAGKPYSFDLELMFDGFETSTDVRPIGAMLLKYVAVNDTHRPPLVLFTWGSTLPAFEGVIESLSVKYTMFMEDGTPCRATVTVHMREASHASPAHNGNETGNETRK